MSNPRSTAVNILHQTLTEHKALNLDTPDSDSGYAFIKMLCFTALRRYRFLTQTLKLFISKKIPHKSNIVNSILLCGATELLFMDSPAYAVINSYVEITKQYGCHPLSGLVNAVLHKIINQKDELLATPQTQVFTDSFFKILKPDYSANTIKKISHTIFSEPPINLTVKNNPEFWCQKLNANLIYQNNLSVPSVGKISSLEGYNDGEWWVQDISASLAVTCFTNLKNKRVLDLCAAPGGKTAQLISQGAFVTSLDCSESRLDTLRQNLQRLNLCCNEIICADAIEYLRNFNAEPFDAILLDAPCSATGVFRKHPELLIQKDLQDVAHQAELQKQILSLISPVLKSGGELVYSVCSISKQEGEQQIKSFIQTYPIFTISPLTNNIEPSIITPEGFIRTLPFHFECFGGCDAFFIAKLIKES